MGKTFEINGEQVIEFHNGEDGYTYLRVRVSHEQRAEVLAAMSPAPVCEGQMHTPGHCDVCGHDYD